MNKDATPESPVPVPSAELRRKTRLSPERFKTDAKPFDGLLGQDRAQEAMSLAASMEADSFNLFVAAPLGVAPNSIAKRFLEPIAAARPQAPDWVYVFNFETPHKPKALELPPGRAKHFRDGIRDLVGELVAVVPAAFETPDFQARRKALEDTFSAKKEEAFETLGEEGRQRDVAIVQTPMGFSLAPLKDGEVLNPVQFNELPEEEQTQRQAQLKVVQEALANTLREVPKWERELRQNLQTLERDTAEVAITHSIEETKAAFQDLPPVQDHLEAMHKDLLDNTLLFSSFAQKSQEAGLTQISRHTSLGPLERYDVNVLVACDKAACGAPVIEEPHPTLANLVGRVENRSDGGVLTTSHTLIKPGALHLANGGFLILDGRSLLREPLSWDALKRTLFQGSVAIESVGQTLNLSTTVTLDPEPIPTKVRVILVGDLWMYFLLSRHDPDFSAKFKLLAEFEPDTPRDDNTETAFAENLLAASAEKDLLPPSIGALERLVEEAARLADHSGKLSLVLNDIQDLMIEASHLAAINERAEISRADVTDTISASRRRLSRISERMQDGILEDVSLIDTEGHAVGVINCLSVFQIGGFRFGKPTRVTARTRPGAGRIVDIEREATLGGPLHSKGVMILTGYLAGKIARDKPLSLHASLVFEQSYGGVDGDSASMGELCALLSSLAEVPLKQSFAITGSMNQRGDAQAIGGVNEKIEGFFEICKARGFKDAPGVIIPQSNVQHLMLSEEVVAACDAGQFAVYPVTTVDDALSLLTDLDPTSLHARVEAKLIEFTEAFQGTSRQSDTVVDEKVTERSDPNAPPSVPPTDTPDDPPKDPPAGVKTAEVSR